MQSLNIFLSYGPTEAEPQYHFDNILTIIDRGAWEKRWFLVTTQLWEKVESITKIDDKSMRWNKVDDEDPLLDEDGPEEVGHAYSSWLLRIVL